MLCQVSLRRLALVLLLTVPIALPAHATDWLTYGFDPTRQAYNPSESTLNASNASQLKQIWSLNVGATDQSVSGQSLAAQSAIEAQPVLAQGVATSSGTIDMLFVGDTWGAFYALNARTGAVIWRRGLGHVVNPCSDFLGGLYGIMGGAAISRSANGGRGAVYVAADAGTSTSATTTVYAFDLATGNALPGWPLTLPDTNASTEGYVYGAITLKGKYLYIGTSADCQELQYHGQVAVFDTSIPAFVRHWWTMCGCSTKPGPLAGPVWGPGGVTYDPNDPVSGIYVATGNGLPYGQSKSEQAPFAEAFVKLSDNLMQTLDYGVPSLGTYNDADFGSSPVLVKPQVAACGGKSFAMALNKEGKLIVFNAHDMGGTAAGAYGISIPTGYLIGDVAYDVSNNILVLGNPFVFGGTPQGILAYKFDSSCKLRLLWYQNTAKAGYKLVSNQAYVSPPTIANGVVYVGTGGDYGPPGGGAPYSPALLVALNEQTGEVLFNTSIAHGALAAPMVVNGMVYEGGFDHQLHAYGLP